MPDALAAALTVLNAAAPVFLLGLVGVVWVRAGFAYDAGFVTRLVLNFCMPALLFSSLVARPPDPAAVGALAAAALGAYVAAGIAVAAGLALSGLSVRTWLVALVNGNTGNLGLPLLLFAFGPEGLAAGIVIFTVQLVLTYTVGIWLLSGAAAPRTLLRQPMLWGVLAGLAAALAGLAPPAPIQRSLELAGQPAIPLMLITLGVSVARLHGAGFGRALAMSLMRLPPCAAAAWGMAELFGLAALPAASLVIQMTTPGAVTSWLLAAQWRRAPDEVAGFVAVSTALAALHLPATLALLGPV